MLEIIWSLAIARLFDLYRERYNEYYEVLLIYLSFVSFFIPSIRVSYTFACVTQLGLLALGGLHFRINGI